MLHNAHALYYWEIAQVQALFWEWIWFWCIGAWLSTFVMMCFVTDPDAKAMWAFYLPFAPLLDVVITAIGLFYTACYLIEWSVRAVMYLAIPMLWGVLPALSILAAVAFYGWAIVYWIALHLG